MWSQQETTKSVRGYGGHFKKKVRRYLDMIPAENRHYLDSRIETAKEVNELAANLSSKWENECHHLDLEYRDVENIMKKHQSKPEVQRIEALQHWRNKNGPNNTYRELLHVFAKAEWHDSALAIVQVLKSKACSSSKTLPRVTPESQSKLAHVRSLSSGDTSDVEVDHPRGSIDEFTLSAKKEFKEINDTSIKRKYSSLKLKIIRSLEHVNIEELKLYIDDIYESDNITGLIDNCNSVLEIFKTLKRHHLLYWGNIIKLRSIAEEFIHDKEIKKEMEDYDASLIGYKAGTKIWQKMDSDSVKQDSDEDEEDKSNHEKRDPSHCKMAVRKRLVITILQEGEQEKGINVTQCSIQYLDDVFQQIQTKFKLSLDAVLDKIASGCIEVTWYIPSSSAHQILNEVHAAVEFLKEIHISTMILEGVLIYSESNGVINAKELNELRLLLAVQDGNIDGLNALMEGCSERLNEPIDKKFNLTLLMLACKYGHHEIVHCLLDYGAVVDLETTKGWTSLRFAACYGHTKVGRLLIHHKANVNCQDTIYGYTPLIHAAQNGHADFVSMMINEVPGLDLDFSAEKGGGWNALMVACKNNHLDTVRELLLGGASPDHQNHNKVAAIHTASFLGLDKMVNTLMLFGADVNIADKWGKTALMFAVRKGNLSVVKRLMESDSLDMNAQEKDAMFSAPFFAIQCKELDILQELMKSGKVNCELKDLKGKTLWDLIQNNSYHDARQFFENDYPREMNKMMSMVPATSTEEASATGPLPTAKAMMEVDYNMLYINQMLNRMDESMAGGAA